MTVFDGMADIFTGVMGQPVLITPAAGAPQVITAIFVSRSSDEMGIILHQPAIHARASDVAALSNGDTVAVSDVAYIAREFRSDGRGMTTVILELE